MSIFFPHVHSSWEACAPAPPPLGAAQLCCQLIAGRGQATDSGKYFINIGYNKLLQWEIKIEILLQQHTTERSQRGRDIVIVFILFSHRGQCCECINSKCILFVSNKHSE